MNPLPSIAQPNKNNVRFDLRKFLVEFKFHQRVYEILFFLILTRTFKYYFF